MTDLPVPDSGPGGNRIFEFLIPKVSSPADLLQYHAVKLWIQDLSARRKAENSRLLALEKAWEQHEAKLESGLKALALEEEAKGAKLMSILGTTYTVNREDAVHLPKDQDNLLVAFCRGARDFDYLVPEEDYVLREHLTPSGVAKIKAMCLENAKQGRAIPEGVVVTPAHKSLATRPRVGSRLSAQQVLAQRGKLEGLTAIETREDQEPLETPEDKETNDDFDRSHSY